MSRPERFDPALGNALARPPSDAESNSALTLLDSLAASKGVPLEDPPETLKKLPPPRRRALAKFCLALFNLNEFAFVD